MAAPGWKVQGTGYACTHNITPIENPSPAIICQAAKEKVAQGYDALKTPMRVPVRHIDTKENSDRVCG